MKRDLCTICAFSILSVSLIFNPQKASAERASLSAGDPLLEQEGGTCVSGSRDTKSATVSQGCECSIMFGAQEDFQKWVNTNAPNAKTLGEVADALTKAFDGNGDGKLNKSETGTALDKLGLVPWYCSAGTAAGKVMDKYDQSGGGANGDKPDQQLDKSEITKILEDNGVKAPAAP